jgi:arabinofuranan 3-O-arabinosyltransferase
MPRDDEVTTGAETSRSRRSPTGRHAGSGRLERLASYLFVAAVCYVPMLLTKPGVVSDDTKTYLYLDPGRLVRSATSMWDPSVALGTVTHQNIGYLLPMGPFFWVLSVLQVPIWVAQRLWMGSILFAAAAGVLYLCRWLGVSGVGRIAAAVAYGLSPYVMQYAGRISVILLPFSGLPWMVAFMVLAARRGGWRYPALFAVVVTLVSGINASSIVYVIVAPLLWLPYAVLVQRELTARRAAAVLCKIGFLTLLTSLWWLAGLSVEGLYGVDILKYTESVEAASSAASSSEVIRGLGYWYFYNGDRMGLWTESSILFTTRFWLLGLSYFVPVAAFLAAAIVKWKDRAFFVLIVLVGLILSVGSHPFASPTPIGALVKAIMTKTTAGDALRSTDRATPLVVLGLAMLLGAGITAVARRFRSVGLIGGWMAVALAMGANAPLLGGDTVIAQFSQPAQPPSYVEAAAHYLNSVAPGTRVYALPGDDFAAYRYGDTVDPIWVGLLNRPFVTHEQFIQGSIPTANLLYAIDNPLQQGTMDWRGLAPIARLMSAGDVLVEYDEQYERYDPPRPALLLHDLRTTPAGLGEPVAFGTLRQNLSTLTMFDETYFDLPPGIPKTPPVVIYPVSDPRKVIRADSLSDPLVIAGDNAGVVSAADVGLLASNPTILFSGTLDTNRALAGQVLAHPAQLVITDTNRKQAFEWNSLAENTGYTETAKEQPTAFIVNDPGFDMFPGSPRSSLTTSVLTGNVGSVSAESYGTAFTLRSEDRPANAIDGNPATAWETEGTVDAPLIGQWWQVTTHHLVSADSVTLVQPQPQRDASWLTNQWVTKATITFDGHYPVTVRLGPESRTPHGEVIAFPRHTFSTMRVRIDRTNLTHGYAPSPVGSSLVGFAEIRVGNLRTAQVVSMPTDLLARTGTSSLKDRLTLVMTRDRVAPIPPRSDPEPYMTRQFRLPSARSFSLVGTAHLSNLVPDNVIDAVVGRTNSLVVSATSSSRMPGNLVATASSTLDGNPKTVWMPGLGTAANQSSWLSYRFRHAVRVSHLTLSISSDAEHSRPTSLLVSAGGVTRDVVLPAIPVTATPGSVTTEKVSFPAVTGDSLRITFAKLALRKTLSYETSLETALPIGIADVSIPGVPREHLGSRVPTTCRSDLLRIDGRPVPISVSGSAVSALQGGALRISACGGASLHIGAGTHLLQAANGSVTGIDVDQLALDSAPGGAAMHEPGNGSLGAARSETSDGAPKISVLSQSSTSIRLHVSGASAPFVLTLGESLNKGWQATVDGGGSLKQHFLVDGFANGWLVTARDLTGAGGQTRSFDVTLRFSPQGEVNMALVLSALAFLGCLAIVLASLLCSRRRRRRTLPAEGETPPADPTPELVLPTELIPVSFQWRHVAAGVVLAGLLGLAAAGPLAGGVVAAGVLASLAWRRGRVVLTYGATLLMVAAGLDIVLYEHFKRFDPGGGWPSHFSLAAELVWIAVVMIGADAGLEAVRQGRKNRRMERGRKGSAEPESGVGSRVG